MSRVGFRVGSQGKTLFAGLKSWIATLFRPCGYFPNRRAAIAVKAEDFLEQSADVGVRLTGLILL